MSFFILPQRATVLKRIDNATFDRSGQLSKPEHATTGERIKCLFYGMTGGKKSGPKQEFDQVIAFYCEGTVDIDEGDLVTNVTGLDDFEVGPFEVLRVTKVTSFSGKTHHLSCKIRGATNR